MTAAGSTRGRLLVGRQSVPCAIGRSGRTAVKREGDGATPIGRFAILHGLYRPDVFRVRPATALPMRALKPTDGWADDPADRNYNRPVRRPYPAGHEALWRDDDVYDLVLVLDCNIRPRARGRGSAIFFHLARPGFSPTAGCVAVARADMLRLLRRLAPKATMVTGGSQRLALQQPRQRTA